MNAEERKLLEETHALAKDTHRVVRQMRREQWYHFFIKLIVWAIVIGAPIYFFTAYISPLVDQLRPPGSAYHNPGWFGLPSTADVQKLIDSYKVKP